MTIEELFGTLQQSVVATWRKHLKTGKYSSHMALDEYYKDAPELIDSLIEDWQGSHEKVEDYKNLLDGKDFDNAIDYLEELRKIVKDGRELMDSSELESDVDAILSQIDSTLYKLKELKEDRSLSNYLMNQMMNESRTTLSEMTDYAASWTRQAWNDRDIRNVLVALTNGVYRELSERQVAASTSQQESNIANKWLDRVEEIYRIIQN